MPKASVKKLIKCKKEQLIDLVLDIEKYPKFVPFCVDAKVYEKKEKGNLLLIVANLTIGKGPFKDTYKSDVKYNKEEDSIFVTNLDGPLKHLKNTWHFKEKNNNIKLKVKIIDDNSKEENLMKIKKIIENSNVNIEIMVKFVFHQVDFIYTKVKKKNLLNLL